MNQITIDNRTNYPHLLIISLELFRTGIIFLNTHPHHVIYYTWVKFHQYWYIGIGEVVLICYMKGQPEGQGDSSTPPPPNFISWGKTNSSSTTKERHTQYIHGIC